MKVGLWVILGVSVIAYYTYWVSGAASNCSFIDTLLHKCGASAS